MTAQPFPLADADRCVKCGLCLPHCPTYRETQHEGDSPRGRIALMQGLTTGMIPLTGSLEAHLDGCLSCRACEVVCPAKVPYGRLIDSARSMLATAKPQRTRLARLIATGLTSKPLRTVLAVLLWCYQRLGLQKLVRRFHLLGTGPLQRLESLLPQVSLPRRFSIGQSASNVGLFLNCISPLAERTTIEAAMKLLSRLGQPVYVPEQQACCGALYWHAGLAENARALAHRNMDAYRPCDTIIGLASGCTAQLAEYTELLPGEDAQKFSGKVSDIHRYIAEHPAFAALRFRSLRARVAVHTPCTLRNVLSGARHVHQLLSRIPDLEVVELEASQRCCGAAGSYFLTQPEMADNLLEYKLDAARRLKPDYLVSANIGCTLHLAAGLRQARLAVPVLHPISLLAAQLEDST